MSKKNSSVNLKNGFRNFEDLSKIFSNFKKKLDSLNKKSYLVGVSGGPDSLALVALTESYKYTKKTKFRYILVDHKIRKNSSKEAKQVKNLLKKNKIKLTIKSNMEKITKNTQAQARKIRYEILSNECKKNKINTLLTAHNLEDQVETFFIRLSRGSGLKGLSAMSSLSRIDNKIYLFRPLLDVKKNHLIKISNIIFGKYFKDPSNKNLKYLRTKVRNLEKPLKKSGIEYEQIIKSINNLALSKATLDEHFNTIFKKIIKKKGREIFLNFKKFKEYNQEIKIGLINESVRRLKSNYYNPRSKKVANLIKNLDKSDYKKSTLGGCVFTIIKENLCLKIEKT
ncbi:tRNA lysidine(34) synthetase TilS [Pelagibacteraceae bacterium]|nr:tRNA lysidine(34) synthetase TilS [Pelagibacteraceae bacterium]MDC1158082.1 tRNA lysidine(34) synthetase TilS [Pelagibacteraceae bacterium]